VSSVARNAPCSRGSGREYQHGHRDAVVAGARRVLRPQGLFAFTVKWLDEIAGAAHFRFGSCRRFARAGSHLTALAAASGCNVEPLEPAVLRQDAGQPVPGWAVVPRPWW